MIDVRLLGVGETESVNLRLLCGVCFAPLSGKDRWLAFVRPGKDNRAVPLSPMWLHRGCLNGSVRRLMGTDAVTLWRASDVLQRLAESLTITET
jgi:hypothetical protein